MKLPLRIPVGQDFRPSILKLVDFIQGSFRAAWWCQQGLQQSYGYGGGTG